MHFQGIGGGEHSSHTHQVTKCMHDHSHFKMEGDLSKGAGSVSRGEGMQTAAQQGEGQLSVSAWLDKYLSKGKGMLRGIWSGGGAAFADEAGDAAGQAQALAQIGDSSKTQGQESADTQERQRHQAASMVQAPQAAQAAAALSQPPAQEASQMAAADVEGAQESIWQKAKVRFKDIAGQLTGHLRGNAFSPQKKTPFQMEQERRREEPKAAKTRKDAVEINSYRVEESYLLDSYDRTGGYSRLSTKK